MNGWSGLVTMLSGSIYAARTDKYWSKKAPKEPFAAPPAPQPPRSERIGGLAEPHPVRYSAAEATMLDLLGTPRDPLSRHLASLGIPTSHTGRLLRGLHREGLPLDALHEVGRHRDALRRAGLVEHSAEVKQAVVTDDGTHKLLLALQDGARVECVLVPMADGRATLCLSTQVGCAMACTFCATGTLGLARHLAAGEIIAQVRAARRHAASTGRTITRLVFMGMGEPLHNYDATADALRVLLDDYGYGYGARQITVSTVGLLSKLQRFHRDFGGRVQLALSLHAGTDATRERIVPAARSAPLASLKEALLTAPRPANRKLMLEYVVLPGVNTTPAELDGLARFTEGLPAVVNLIPFNPFPGAPFRSPTVTEVHAVQDGLRQRNTFATVRWPKGRSTASACGQLVAGASA